MTIHLRSKAVDAFTDKLNDFASARSRNERRAAGLINLALDQEAPQDPDPVILREALDQLRLQHEELIVAEEELRAQLEELSQMEHRIESERQSYLELFEHAPDAYLVTDSVGALRDANAAATALLGVEHRFLKSKPISAFVERSDVARVRSALTALNASTSFEPVAIEFTLRPRGGDPVRATARVSKSRNGDRRHWTIRHMALPAVDRAHGLERLLRDKEEVLGRERRARVELERANEAKDRFIAVLSHDLRSPLNAILGWVQLLQREILDGVARKRAFETIERNALAQAGLIEELLDISRMATDRFHLELQPTDLGLVVERAVESALPSATGMDVTLALAKAPDGAVCTILGDARRLEQIVTNLLANALKFTPAGGRVDVAIRVEGEHVSLAVTDTGKGIAPALLPRIFDLYTQERDSVTTRNGLGLGLYIVKRLVGLQDGTVQVESEGGGKGAVFTVTFPRLLDRVSAPPPPSGKVAVGSLVGKRVLIVDDEEDARDLVAAILARAGAAVQCAPSAQVAEQLHAYGGFDVLVSDVAMPGMDGCELLEHLRALDPELVAVAVSGFAADADAKRALASGFDAYLSKPAKADDIVTAVTASIRRRSLAP